MPIRSWLLTAGGLILLTFAVCHSLRAQECVSPNAFGYFRDYYCFASPNCASFLCETDYCSPSGPNCGKGRYTKHCTGEFCELFPACFNC